MFGRIDRRRTPIIFIKKFNIPRLNFFFKPLLNRRISEKYGYARMFFFEKATHFNENLYLSFKSHFSIF
jgi:hypothetical protein